MLHNEVDHSVHLSDRLTLPAFPAIVDGGKGETAFRALWANRLFPPNHKAHLLCNFQDGNLLVDPLEIRQGSRIMNIVVSFHNLKVLLCGGGLRLRVIRHGDLRI